jgi:hypothetical protein
VNAAVFTLAAAFSVLPLSSARSALILSETWETPALAPGTSTATVPPGWVRSGLQNPDTVHPNNTAEFNQVESLASPAGGNQYLKLSNQNNGLSRMTGFSIPANAQITLSAAIGNSKLISGDDGWSIQLWADTNANGAFDGGDSFLGQQFGTAPRSGERSQWGMGAELVHLRLAGQSCLQWPTGHHPPQ